MGGQNSRSAINDFHFIITIVPNWRGKLTKKPLDKEILVSGNVCRFPFFADHDISTSRPWQLSL